MAGHATVDELVAAWDAYDRPADGAKCRHYKGGEYVIVATGYLEASETPAVIYRSLTNDMVWVRTADDFFAGIEYEGVTVPRFTVAALDE